MGGARPARPNIPNSEPYTGFDGVAPGITGGLMQWIVEARRTSQDVLWSNGAYGVRPIRGGKQMSVHATGRAVDLSYKRFQGKGKVGGKPLAMAWLDRVIENANLLGVECVLDYAGPPHGFGRGWFCNVQRWNNYARPTIKGAPGGTWFHIELAPAMARDARKVRAAFAQVFPEIPPLRT